MRNNFFINAQRNTRSAAKTHGKGLRRTKQKGKKAKKRLSWQAPVLLLILLALGAWLIYLRTGSSGSATVLKETESAEAVVKNTDTIDIPGYESLTLAADSREQRISLANPPQNTCFFQISLCLEDGSVLWTSELIPPGYASESIRLSRALPAGSYPNATLRYACFTLDDSRQPLNGAETKLTLIVK